MDTQAFIKRFFLLLLFTVLQVFVFGRIALFGYATPLVYIWMILRLDSSVSKYATLLWAFFLGLAIDIFSATPGLNAAAATLTGLLRPVILSASVRLDKHDILTPCSRTMGKGTFAAYLSILTLIHSLVYFLLRNIPFAGWSVLLADVLGSTLLTFLIIYCIDVSFPGKSERRYTSNL